MRRVRLEGVQKGNVTLDKFVYRDPHRRPLCGVLLDHSILTSFYKRLLFTFLHVAFQEAEASVQVEAEA